MGVETGMIDKSGSWYAYNGERIGQGRENVKKYFDEHKELYDEILLKVRANMGIAPKKESTGTEETLVEEIEE